ncbi:histone-lysine N-methyltransferase SETMAR [Trichonephila clavipes]|nr:histone-lysine N-methyltransferase SETMAR [Trichonephila clavipes]
MRTRNETSAHRVTICWIPKEAENPSESFPSYVDGHRRVRRGVRDKRLDLVDSPIILHNKAKLHKAECVRHLLRRRRWEELKPPPYSPFISPCDFDLIPKINEPKGGRWFATRENIANAVRQQLT